ncbi:phosphatidate cytidylyltransferase [Actinocorallia sp. API 0066]|uniref:phosphatidate cytidylyltransferase n=1 Tax=Actinocorallia sp. API 0066 TaxID=2896846 RepID=UPI001E2FBBAF|nr:phosphatidate cytidylyltransferase [Actinocorallia sp. API 0066]MCD0448422.1 phosphatidate cytidylyltransferase [Actinocorallia sp. API 0066]
MTRTVEPTTKRNPGRNVPVAVGVGAGLGALVLASLYTARESFLVVLLVFGGIALRELTGAFRSRDINVPLFPVALGGAAMLPAAYYRGPGGMVVTLALTVLVTLIWRMKDGADGYVRDTTAAVFTMVYLPFLVGFALLMLAHPDGPDRITVFIAVTVASDIGGFFVGAYLGKHKIAPLISPKKTWEGFAGSAFTCMLVGALLLMWRLDGHWWQGVILGACVVLTATLGDLVESMIKRDLGIKDLGTLLPGHGGVMDRLDSLLVTVPVAWILFESFEWLG